MPNRAAHALALLSAIDQLPNAANEGLPGIYLDVKARPNEPLKKASLDSSGLTLLRFEEADLSGTNQETATVFATSTGIENLRAKIEQFRTEDTEPREKDGIIIPGRPKNADLIQSMAAITEAGLRALWRSPEARFPSSGLADWEIWLDPASAATFIAQATELGVLIGADRLVFPEDLVIIARATREDVALVVRRFGGVRALATVSVTADAFDGLPVAEQAVWTRELADRTSYPATNVGYVTVMDTGISRAHPLLEPLLAASDRYAANPAWGVEDTRGHGTQMAGLALYGDLTSKLYQINPIEVGHRLESVKLLPDADYNPHHLLGAITRDAVNAVESQSDRRRTFLMATTTGEDTPHDGAPTSWSSEIDQLAAGVSGDNKVQRLVLLSAGNTDNFTFGAGHYLQTCDHNDNEIESPAQAWNAISVGAYTEKTALPPAEALTPLAPFGDLSPSSRTASWTSYWPIKPDVVFEGGNWASQAAPPPMRHGWLSLLSTHYSYPQRAFTFSHDTSDATALAAKAVTELWTEYPTLWPETVRALFVSLARWTAQMKSHLPVYPQKGDYAKLFRRYGYGVPDLARAKSSASNALTLIVEDYITPYAISDSGSDVHNEMKLFTLPWPVASLRALNDAQVKLRVTLSSFIAPNPSEASRGSRYRYASHNLRFKLNRADENATRFMARISRVSEQVEGIASVEDDQWEFGSDRRDVGSLHIDQLTCRASDLARRNIIAVHPVAGWWKAKAHLRGELPTVRYALIVEIDAEHLEVDIRTEVQTAIAALVAARTVVSV